MKYKKLFLKNVRIIFNNLPRFKSHIYRIYAAVCGTDGKIKQRGGV